MLTQKSYMDACNKEKILILRRNKIMAVFTTGNAERITKIYNDSGISANNIAGMAMANGVTYCIKAKTHETNIADKFSIYQYDDYESIEKVTPQRVEGYMGYGLAFNPYTKKLYVAGGKKVFTTKVDDLTYVGAYDVKETSTKAITYYHSNMEILLADSLSTNANFCFLVGKFGSGIFNKYDEFYVEKSNMVESAGYNKIKDIYYNGTNGLFVVTNYSDVAQCKNRILRISMKTQIGTYNSKPIYGIDEVIDINFDKSEYTQCDIESLALDKYGRMVFVGNAIVDGIGRDWFFRVTDRIFEMKTEVNFSCETTKVMELLDKTVNGENLHYLTGMTMNGNAAYFVKTSSNNRNGLYKYAGIGSALSGPIVLPDVGKSFGMTYHNNFVYIAHRNSIGQYTLSGKLIKTFSCSGIDSITHLEENDFLVMQYKPVSGKLYFRVWDLSGDSIIEKDWFTVESKGYTDLQDIYYHPLHGLFIATQGDLTTCKNIVLRVDMTYYMKNRNDANKWNGANIPVASRWNINFSTTTYSRCYVESLSITPEGELLVACNAKLADGTVADALFKVTNLTFRKDRTGIWANANIMNELKSKTGVKCVPGCLAKNGRKMYCITTNTKTNNESYFMETTDYRNKDFELNPNIITGVAHCNGGTYHKGFLYTCNYLKYSQREMGMFALVASDGKITNRNSFNEDKICVDSGEKYFGAITYYKDDKFLLIDYVNTSNDGYAELIKIHIGRFVMENGTYHLNFDDSPYITIRNPLYLEGDVNGLLQDMHYEPGIGLFIGGISKEPVNKYYIMRVDIDTFIGENKMMEISPCEIYYPIINGVNHENESMVMSEYGELLVSINNSDSDVLVYPESIVFDREL